VFGVAVSDDEEVGDDVDVDVDDADAVADFNC
jgi:hypothetical protein